MLGVSAGTSVAEAVIVTEPPSLTGPSLSAETTGGTFWMFTERVTVSVIAGVPLSITGPGVAPGTSDARAQQIDFMPTVLSMLGVGEMPEGLPGIDLLNPPAAERAVFMERDRPPGYKQRTIIDGDLKLIAIAPADTNLIPWASRGTFAPYDNVRAGTFMYDLSYDPDKTDNVYIEGAPHTERLLAKLNAFMEGRGAESSEVQMDDATREKLEALGYVQ